MQIVQQQGYYLLKLELFLVLKEDKKKFKSEKVVMQKTRENEIFLSNFL